jgi:PAS domain-containing protein
MSDTHQSRPGTAATERYEALFRVSQTLIAIRSSEELFRLLARELRAVVRFYVMGVGIYDEKAHEMHTTSYGEPGVPLEAPRFAPEETFSWWVYQHQEPLIIPFLDAETRFPAVAEMLKNRGVRSVCVLPLTTVHRRLGGLALGSTEADAYSAEEVNFLSFVANQVALAVDDALNFDALQRAEEALRASEQSFRMIVDSIPGLVNTTTAEGEFEFVSRQCLNYFGTTLEELPPPPRGVFRIESAHAPHTRHRNLTKWVATTDRHPCKLTRAFSPRNSMKMVSIPAIIHNGVELARSKKTVERLKPNVSLILSVRDRANEWCVVSPPVGAAIARDPG